MKQQVRSEHFAKAKVFDDLPEKVILKAENTFCMALDGDVDFKPNAVQLLIDRLRRNKKVGVVCGRIHPIGSGNLSHYLTLLTLCLSKKSNRIAFIIQDQWFGIRSLSTLFPIGCRRQLSTF